MPQPPDDGSLEIHITASVSGIEEAKALAMAVMLLRYYASTYGDDRAVEVAEEAAEALRDIDIDVST